MLLDAYFADIGYRVKDDIFNDTEELVEVCPSTLVDNSLISNNWPVKQLIVTIEIHCLTNPATTAVIRECQSIVQITSLL